MNDSRARLNEVRVGGEIGGKKGLLECFRGTCDVRFGAVRFMRCVPVKIVDLFDDSNL